MPKGIINLGNTCYIASIIQNLLSTNKLTEYLNSDLFNNFLQQINNNLSKEQSNKLCIYNIYKVLHKLCNDIEYRVNIINLRILFTHYNNNVGQQDAQEFLGYVLDTIHEEIKCSVSIEFNNIPDNIKQYFELVKDMSEFDRKKLKKQYHEEDIVINSLIYYNNLLKNNYSQIINIFGGIYITEIKCLQCNESSIKFEYMTMLPLCITNNNSIIDLFNDYCKVELLDNDNMYHCELCNKKTNAEKSIRFWELPQRLIIVFKKYSNNLTINNINITYPIELNIRPYISPIKCKYWNIKSEYELYSVTKHTGTLDSGHYYSYVKNNDPSSGRLPRVNKEAIAHGAREEAHIRFHGYEWFKCDDENISPCSLDEVLNSNGYILWYKIK